MDLHQTDIYPHLDLSKNPARRASAYSRVEGKRSVLGNGFLETQMDYGKKNPKKPTITNKITGECIRLHYSPFEVFFESETIKGGAEAFKRIETGGSPDISLLSIHYSFEWCDVEVSFSLRRGDHYFQKSVIFRNIKKDAYLDKATLLKHKVAGNYKVLLHDAGMYFPVVFLRCRKSSVFFCLDFPGHEAFADETGFRFDHRPGERLTAGRSFMLATACVGICSLAGRHRSNPYHESSAHLDVGEQQWFREFLYLSGVKRKLPHIELVAPDAAIEGVSDLESIDQCDSIGAKHVVIPRMLKDLDSYPQAQAVKERLRTKGISAAFAMPFKKTQNLNWVALDSDGTPAGPEPSPCFGCDDFRDSLVDHYLEMMDRHGFTDAQVVGSPIVECCSPHHGHHPGTESIPKAFEGLTEIAAALAESYGHVRCGRPYGAYGAGLAKMFDSITVLAKEHPLPLPDIHIGRLFADMERLYFRRSHDFLLPKSNVVNSVGLVPESCPNAPHPGTDNYPWYLYHDSLGWRYAVISAIATGLRHRFHALPQDMPEEDKAFAKKWLEWEENHISELLEVEEILDEPGIGSIDGYSYTSSRGSIIFLFNTTYDYQAVNLKLHLDHDSDYIARELYPTEMNYMGPNDGLFRRDSKLELRLRPKEAKIVEIVRRSPAHTRRKRPEVFGAPGRGEGNIVTLSGAPGSKVQIGIRTPKGFIKQNARFPGQAFNEHITEWVCAERSLEQGLPTLTKGAFPGKQCNTHRGVRRNVWLCSQILIPKELEPKVDTSPFELSRPCWAHNDRMFFVLRFEPPGAFDPIRTSSTTKGIPEAYLTALPMKCGIDLTHMNLGLKVWINGISCPVYPALAPWDGLMPNPHPVVAYYVEAGSKLDFGRRNRVVIFASRFEPAVFRGVVVEHPLDFNVEKEISIK